MFNHPSLYPVILYNIFNIIDVHEDLKKTFAISNQNIRWHLIGEWKLVFMYTCFLLFQHQNVADGRIRLHGVAGPPAAVLERNQARAVRRVQRGPGHDGGARLARWANINDPPTPLNHVTPLAAVPLIFADGVLSLCPSVPRCLMMDWGISRSATNFIIHHQVLMSSSIIHLIIVDGLRIFLFWIIHLFTVESLFHVVLYLSKVNEQH